MITTTIIFLSFLVLFCWIQRYIIINLSVSSYSEKITTKQPTKQPTKRKPTDICILIYSYSLYMLNFEIVYHIHNPQKECYLEVREPKTPGRAQSVSWKLTTRVFTISSNCKSIVQCMYVCVRTTKKSKICVPESIVYVFLYHFLLFLQFCSPLAATS